MTTNPKNWLNEIEALTNFTNHITFVENLMRTSCQNMDRRNELQRQIESLRRRANSENLSLAIVGEFNSGKSSFINGILRNAFLKTSLIPTTATATRISYAPKITVDATVANQKYHAEEGDYTALAEGVRALKPELSKTASFNEVVGTLTADNVVGRKTRDVAIGYPSDLLKNNLILLDTPGISAGTNATDYHGDVTVKVVEDEADAAIVLFSPDTSANASVLAFLRDHAARFLSRCIFVITKMEKFAEPERKQIVKFIRTTLREELKIEKPVIYESAALTLLKPKNYSDEERAYWNQSFFKMEQNLFQDLIRLRSIIISEKLVSITNSLLVRLQKTLDEKKNSLSEEKQVLDRNKIADLKNVMRELEFDALNQLEEGKNIWYKNIDRIVSSAISSAKSDIYGYIKDSGWELQSEYDEEFKPYVRDRMEDCVEDAAKMCKKEMKSFKRCAKNVANGITEGFSREFADFETLGFSMSQIGLGVNSSSSDVSFDGVDLVISNANSMTNQQAGIGAGAGAFLGTCILPGIGTIVGAIFGGFLGSFFRNEEQLQELKKALKSTIKNMMGDMKSKMRNMFQQSVNYTHNAVSAQIQDLVRQYVQTYSNAVNQLQRKYNTDLNRINQEISMVEADTKRTLEHQNQLTNTKKKLETIH